MKTIGIYLVIGFFLSCSTEQSSKTSEKNEEMFWLDEDSTKLYREDYTKLVNAATSSDTSLAPFLFVFRNLRSKPSQYDALSVLSDIGWILLEKSNNNNGFPEKGFENIIIKRNILFERMNHHPYEFTCYTTSAPIDDWLAFKNDGTVRSYGGIIKTFKWSLEDDTLAIVGPKNTILYVDQDTVFDPVKPGHLLYVLWR